MPKILTREQILNFIRAHGYIMSPVEENIKLCDNMCNEGILIRADKAGDRNPVGDFNSSYTYLEA